MLIQTQCTPIQIELKNTPTATTEPRNAIVEVITDEILRVFGDNSTTALRVAKCESGFNPEAKNKSSSASGVFQIIKGTWQANSDYSWEDRFDYKKNIETAKNIFDRSGWHPWECF